MVTELNANLHSSIESSSFILLQIRNFCAPSERLLRKRPILELRKERRLIVNAVPLNVKLEDSVVGRLSEAKTKERAKSQVL